VIGITAAVIVLLFAFGTVVAMGLPIVTAILGLVAGLSMITLLGHVISVPSAAPILATMMGLGVGIDYSLFIVTRHKAHMRAGYDIPESIARATATAGGAVLFAGSTVVIALLSLSLVGIPIVSSLGYTAAIVVGVAVFAALTLLPALLGLVGPRINSLRVPFGRHEHHDEKPHGWLRWAEGVAKRPVPALLAAVAVLGVLAIPLLSLNLGQADNSVEPKSSDVRRSYDLLTAGFGVGANGPLLISVDLSKPAKPDQQKLNQVSQQQAQLQQEQAAEEAQAAQEAKATGVTPGPSQAQAQLQAQSKQLAAEEKQLNTPASDPRLAKLGKQMGSTSGVKSVTPPLVNSQGTAAIYSVQPTSSPSSQKTVDLVNSFRDSVIPDATKGQQMTAYVGGSTAGYIDLADEISNKLPEVILIVVGLSFLILLLGFRSIALPIESALMNLLSVGAAYGVVTFVFQEGHGAKLIGLPHAIPIVSFLPLMMFAILFGLSMDYQVFLLSQISEKHRQGADNRTAVIEGLASSGRVITSAALIMVSVFASFILSGDPTTKQFGVGLAVAIAIDATIVRCLLVPAMMVLVGRANWWLPDWLDRVLPRVSVEGDEYFATRKGATGR
jgi:RND superfamily putative drug exporter